MRAPLGDLNHGGAFVVLAPEKERSMRMDTYLNVISSKHQDKLGKLARISGVTAEFALLNIVKHLENNAESSSRPDYFKDLMTAKDIEWMIDLITC